MIGLLRQGDPDTSADLLQQLFIHELKLVNNEQKKIGRTLVLRDHSHSHFLTGSTVTNRPTLLEMLLDQLQFARL